jgi:hypothetical protein
MWEERCEKSLKKEKCGKLCFLYKNNGKIKRVIVEYVE